MKSVTVIILICIFFTLAECSNNTYYNVFPPTFYYEGNSYFQMGQKLGKQFNASMHSRFNKDIYLQETLLEFYKTAQGLKVFNTFLEIHQQKFPHYLDELKGVSNATGIEFNVIFISNIADEYDSFIENEQKNKTQLRKKQKKSDHCSDYLIKNQETTLVAHNEDDDECMCFNNYFANITIYDPWTSRKIQIQGFCNLGNLCSQAFAWNQNGIAYTINSLWPYNVTYGFGFTFVMRKVLESVNIQEAIETITDFNVAGGLNINLMDINQQKIINIEKAPLGLYAIKEIFPANSPYFHANIYQTLNTPQEITQYALHRLKRVSELPRPQSEKEALNVIGDQYDKEYPLFHDDISIKNGDISECFTIASVVFNLKEQIITFYKDNPSLEKVGKKISLKDFRTGIKNIQQQ